MFSYDEIQKFNETEIRIYKFIIANGEKLPYMTIRELADETNVSTSTILRLCNKLECEGYKEFKERLKTDLCHIYELPPKDDLNEILHYFKGTNTSAFEQKIAQGANYIHRAEAIIFIGGGSSGTLARYGARYFTNCGKLSWGLEDPYYLISKEMVRETVVIALSVSGETKEVIHLIDSFKAHKCKILSITNQSNSTIAKMSDWNISYNMNVHKMDEIYNTTSQVPVLFLIEALARRM